MFIALVAVEAFAFQQGNFPGQPGTWRTFTDMRNVRSIASADGAVWAATSGGLFRWDEGTQAVRQYTNSEGLSSNDLTAVYVDAGGRVWIGTSEGSINVLEDGQDQWRVIDDIRISGRVQKRIRTFVVNGDSLFIGTDFGVSVFRLSRWEFGDTYANLGFPAPASANEIVVTADRLWIATNQGVASAQRFLTNLSSPTNWVQYQTGQGLPSNNATCAAFFHDTLVVGTSLGAAFFGGASFQPISSMSGPNIVSVVTTAGSLNFLVSTSGYEIRSLTSVNGGTSSYSSFNDIPTDLAYNSGSSSWFIGTVSKGFDQQGPVQRSIAPNGPPGNIFSSLVVDPGGALWSATGISGQGRGFSRYQPDLPPDRQWKNFTVADNPVMGSNDYYKVAVGSQDRIWVSSWGSGAVEVRGDSIVRRIDANSTPSFSTSDNSNPSYPVINGVALDGSGQTWFVNWGAKNRNFLACLTSDTTFSYHTTNLVPEGFFTSMVIDENGTKWLANTEPFHPAKGLYLYYYNQDRLVSGTTLTNGWGFMSEADGLPENNVISLAVDRAGSVCVGTELGLMIIFDPVNPKQRKFSSFPLREQSIQAIAVDALNNKWVGTKEGLFVMNSDATQILQQYTTSNTRGLLVANDIRSLAIDQDGGIVYIGTERGLSSLSIAAVETNSTFSTLEIGPNPFVIPSQEMLMIRNLVDESSIKILKVDGSLVSEFKAQGGGRGFWNGRDLKGNLVGSGIYFVVAFAENGEQVATGKVAVIRK
jgi:ligand-binding sensor domain-containing protein